MSKCFVNYKVRHIAYIKKMFINCLDIQSDDEARAVQTTKVQQLQQKLITIKSQKEEMANSNVKLIVWNLDYN